MFWEYIEKLEECLSNYPEYVILVTGVYFSIFASNFTKLPTDNIGIIIIVCGVGLLVVSGISLWLSYYGKKKLKECLKENQILKLKVDNLTEEDVYHQDTIHEIVEFLNKYIGDDVLQFGNQTHKTDRISLYVFDEDGFFPIARYSANPTYNTLRRHWYPPNQGAICHAWDDGEYFKTYPDPIASPDEYFSVLETLEHIPRSDAEQFSMKPRLIFGYRIGETHAPKAVFIVESTKVSRFTKLGLESSFRESDQCKMCIDIILRLELPNPYIGDVWEGQ